jgi:hypothetical protein
MPWRFMGLGFRKEDGSLKSEDFWGKLHFQAGNQGDETGQGSHSDPGISD